MNYLLTFYTNKIKHHGETRGPIILIKPQCRDDTGLHIHELTHVKQWFRTLGIHSFLYLFSKSYRLKAEVEAYREQLKHYLDDRSALFAHYLANDYGFEISQEEAMRLLK